MPRIATANTAAATAAPTAIWLTISRRRLRPVARSVDRFHHLAPESCASKRWTMRWATKFVTNVITSRISPRYTSDESSMFVGALW